MKIEFVKFKDGAQSIMTKSYLLRTGRSILLIGFAGFLHFSLKTDSKFAFIGVEGRISSWGVIESKLS